MVFSPEPGFYSLPFHILVMDGQVKFGLGPGDPKEGNHDHSSAP
jgi:hypothetical protein